MNGRKASYVNKFRRSFLSPFVLSHEKRDQNEKRRKVDGTADQMMVPRGVRWWRWCSNALRHSDLFWIF